MRFLCNNKNQKTPSIPEDTYRGKNRRSKRLISFFKRSKERNPDNASYAPTINEELITLQSTERNELYDCNIINAYNLKEPLSIGIPGKLYGKTCFNYNSKEAKKYLLH